MSKFPKKWEIWVGNFDKIKEFSKDFQPVVILSNNIQNEFSEKVIVAPFSTDLNFINDKFEAFVKKPRKMD